MYIYICEYVWRKGGEGNSNKNDDDTVARNDNHNNDNNETRYTTIMMILRIHRMSKIMMATVICMTMKHNDTKNKTMILYTTNDKPNNA